MNLFEFKGYHLFLRDKHSFQSKRRYTDEGFLVVPSRIARTGIQDYFAGELGIKDGDPMRVIRVYRPPEEVFSPESMQSFENKSITDNHPQKSVSIENVKSLTVGHTASGVERDGDFLIAELHIKDAKTIKQVESGKVELSNGYSSDIEFVEGVTDSGQKYDAVQRNIRGNHIAIVEKGRAGSAVKISDNKKEPTMAKINVSGVDIEVTDQAKQAFEVLQGQLKDAEEEKKKMEDEEEEEKKKTEDEDEEEKKKESEVKDSLQAKLDDAKSKIWTDSEKKAFLKSEISLVSDAKAICPDLDITDKLGLEIKKAVVADKRPSIDLADKSADYINASFDLLLDSKDDSKTHVLDSALNKANFNDTKNSGKTISEIARDKMITDSANRWKGDTK